MPAAPPDDPFALARHAPFAPAATRRLEVFGATAELVWVPSRKQRRNRPGAARPPFRASFVERILADETLWRGGGVALTPNRYPLAGRNLVLWAEEPAREAPLALLATAFALAARAGGTVLLNGIGAAASIPRAHVHLVDERLPFLERFAAVPFRPDYLAPRPGLEVLRLGAPFPGLAVGVRGAPEVRARAVHRLLEIRCRAAANVVGGPEVTWVFPRSHVETPAPWFPHALGAAELWGRWLYPDEAPFRRAGRADLEQALRVALTPP